MYLAPVAVESGPDLFHSASVNTAIPVIRADVAEDFRFETAIRILAGTGSPGGVTSPGTIHLEPVCLAIQVADVFAQRSPVHTFVHVVVDSSQFVIIRAAIAIRAKTAVSGTPAVR